MPILKSHLYSYLVTWNIKGTMMERFISRGLICKCATHFSPPAKKQNSRSFNFWGYPSWKVTESFAKEKEQRKEDPLQIQEQGKGLLQPSSNLHQWIQVWWFKYCIIRALIHYLELYIILWSMAFYSALHYLLFPTFGIRAMVKESIHLGFRNYEKLGFLINNSWNPDFDL